MSNGELGGDMNQNDQETKYLFPGPISSDRARKIKEHDEMTLQMECLHLWQKQ